MDFCLHVATFYLGLTVFSAACFTNNADRIAFVKGKQRERVEFVVVFCNRRELRGLYSAHLLGTTAE